MKRYLVPILMVLSLGSLMGDDCDIDIDGWDGWHGWGYPDYVVVDEPVYYYEPCCW